MASAQHEWQRTLHEFTLHSKRLDEDLREHPWNQVKNTWHTTPAGKALCCFAQKCWTETVLWWSRTDIDGAPNSVMAYATITVDFLDGLACDYVYRRNNAAPSGPLWDALDRSLDMPALWNQLLWAIDRRRCDDWYVNEALDTLNRRLSLVALARVQSNYPLHDSPSNATVWADAPELHHFWREQEKPDEARHQSFVHGLRQLPSSMAAFYAYSATYPLPHETTALLLDQCSLDPADVSMDAVLLPWCSWLATLQNQPEHWGVVQQKWPDLAHVTNVVHGLDSSGATSTQILHLYRQCHASTLVPTHELANLFDACPSE